MKQFSFSKFISHIYLSDQQQIMILAIGFFIIFIAIFVILRIFSDETAKRKPKKVKQEVYDENEDLYEKDEKEKSIKRSKKAIQYEEKYLTFWNLCKIHSIHRTPNRHWVKLKGVLLNCRGLRSGSSTCRRLLLRHP